MVIQTWISGIIFHRNKRSKPITSKQTVLFDTIQMEFDKIQVLK